MCPVAGFSKVSRNNAPRCDGQQLKNAGKSKLIVIWPLKQVTENKSHALCLDFIMHIGGSEIGGSSHDGCI